MAPEPSRDLDALYAVALPEFTRHRNELAARLQKTGQRNEAAAVRRLKRPSVPVWAINTLAREQADAVRAFVDATDGLKRAQLGDRGAVTAATQAQRRALQALMRSTEAILRRAKFSPTAQTLQRISGTLLGAATDRDARRELLHGRLTEERQAPGFDALAGAPVARAPERQKSADPPPAEPARKRVNDARRLRARARAEHRAHTALAARRAARARAEDLAAKVRALEAEAVARERAAAEASRAAAELAQQLREAETRARALRHEAGTVATAAKRARREAARLAARLPR
jgi:hypothetical protein